LAIAAAITGLLMIAIAEMNSGPSEIGQQVPVNKGFVESLTRMNEQFAKPR
jgi:hypothetical protein